MTDTHRPRPADDPLVAYQTRLLTVRIPGMQDLQLHALADRRQYSDPDGEAEQLGISSALWPLSGLLWPSSLYLTKALIQHTVPTDSRILEIGCGLALPSLFCHRQGWRITASDHHPLVLELLTQNLLLNNMTPDLPYRHGDWNGLAHPTPYVDAAGILSEQFDFILGSDLLYERNAGPVLAAFIEHHAKARCSVWMVDANRGGRPAFNRSMQTLGFTLQQDIRLNRKPCLSGAESYKGHLLKYTRG